MTGQTWDAATATPAQQAYTALTLAAFRLRDLEGPSTLRAYRKAHRGRVRGFIFTPSTRLVELCDAAAAVLSGTLSPDAAMNLLYRVDIHARLYPSR